MSGPQYKLPDLRNYEDYSFHNPPPIWFRQPRPDLGGFIMNPVSTNPTMLPTSVALSYVSANMPQPGTSEVPYTSTSTFQF